MELQVFSKRFNQVLSLLLAPVFVITQCVEFGFSQQPAPQLRIVVVEGDGAINNVRQRVARETIVQVNDENNRPVGGALVTFALPNSGASGSYANGAKVVSVRTNAVGRATAPKFTPNNVAGDFQINVNASYQGQTGMATISQTNSATAASTGTSATTAATSGGGGGGISATVIGIIAAIAGTAATVAVVATRGKSKPTITIGPGGGPSVGAPQ